MQSVTLTGLDQLNSDLEDLLNEIPGMRREMHQRIADALKDEVDIQINSSGLNDSNDRIKGWQEVHVGSGGGYAAVRAVTGAIGDNSPGAITNYLENGHKIREPSGTSKRYRPHIRTPYVSGYHFYNSARHNAEWRAIAAAEEYVNEVFKIVEG